MPASLRIAVARPADWPAVARWAFDRFREPFAGLRADRLVGLLVRGEVATDGILVATRAATTVGGLVLQHLPGGTAVMLLPGGESEEVRGALVAAAVERFPDAEVVVAQAFVDLAEEAAAAVLTRHGFRRVTVVNQMSLEPPFPAYQPRPLAGMRFVPFAEDATDFAETLLATYRQSEDVPEANARRTAAQVLAGFRHGQPDPPDWWRATDADGTPLGVLLLTAGDGVLEVTYLGVVPEARRRGVGRALLQFAITRASETRRSVDLSVDERNRPAVRLYSAHGFRITRGQHVFLWIATDPHG